MSIADYEAMLHKQGGKCALCERTENLPFKTFTVDHCHQTNKIRGLLCHKCNTALGQFKDSVAVLLKAANYLEGV